MSDTTDCLRCAAARDEGLVTAHVIASRLGVKSTWVLRQARMERIPAVHLGKYVRFRWDEVSEALGVSGGEIREGGGT